MRKFSGIFVTDGLARRMIFEAKDHDEAVKIAALWNVGVEGETSSMHEAPTPPPEVYDEKNARRLLGGISLSSLYRELALGQLERMPGTRRLLITRRSIEKRAR